MMIWKERFETVLNCYEARHKGEKKPIHQRRQSVLNILREYLRLNDNPRLFIDIVENYLKQYKYKYSWWSLYLIPVESQLFNEIKMALHHISEYIQDEDLKNKLKKAEEKIKKFDDRLKDELVKQEGRLSEQFKVQLNELKIQISSLHECISEKDVLISSQTKQLYELLKDQDEGVLNLITALQNEVLGLSQQVSRLQLSQHSAPPKKSPDGVERPEDARVDIELLEATRKGCMQIQVS